jgi:hypothetical protein
VLKLFDLNCGPSSLRTGGSQFYLEVFAGSGHLTAALRAAGEAVLPIDVSRGERHDVLDESVFVALRSWLANGMVLGLWLGTLF